MKSFWAVLPEIEDHIRVSQVGGWVSLLTMKKIWELDWVIDEEDWSVVSNHIVVALLSVEFDCKSTWVSHGISSTSLTSNSRESEEQWSLLANFVQESGLGEFCD